MLSKRILATLKFFDMQNVPLTLFELHKFLLADVEALKPRLNEEFELGERAETSAPISIGDLALELNSLVKSGAVREVQGYFCLPDRENIISERLTNYAYGLQRERRSRRFAWFLRYIPFVRGAAIGGSQAMGQQTAESDIDLFIITDESRIWTARTLVSAFFQMFGVRRHHEKIANRFCLNHYVAGPREVSDERDIYNAMEYLRLRGIIYSENVAEFVNKNSKWISQWFPEAQAIPGKPARQSKIQKFFEAILNNALGAWLERKLGGWQIKRIQRGEYAVATGQELSFHSKERKYKLLREFFGKDPAKALMPEPEFE